MLFISTWNGLLCFRIRILIRNLCTKQRLQAQGRKERRKEFKWLCYTISKTKEFQEVGVLQICSQSPAGTASQGTTSPDPTPLLPHSWPRRPPTACPPTLPPPSPTLLCEQVSWLHVIHIWMDMFGGQNLNSFFISWHILRNKFTSSRVEYKYACSSQAVWTKWLCFSALTERK